MKVLILSVTAGQGHHQCAMAVSDYLKENGVECDTIDCISYINTLLSGSISHGYLLSTQYSPTAYGKAYRLAEKKSKPWSKMSIPYLTAFLMSKKLEKYIRDYNPDAIICTHVLAGQFVSDMRKLEIPTFGIVTDFTFHPFWEDTDLDYYVLASESLINQAGKKLIPQDKVLPFGIPINEKFNHKISKEKARGILGIENKRTVLLVSGSMGFGNIPEMLRALDNLDIDFQIISVCGKNKKAKRFVDRINFRKKVHNFGYVDNIDIMMDAADVIITKPGGLTTSEALSKEVPMVLMHPIPGQEERNAEFFLNNGVAMMVSETFPIDECLFELLDNDWRLPLMEQAVSKIAKPNAAKDLGDFIIEHINSKLCK